MKPVIEDNKESNQNDTQPITDKACSKCSKILPVTNFMKNTGHSKDSLRPDCKECHRIARGDGDSYRRKNKNASVKEGSQTHYQCVICDVIKPADQFQLRKARNKTYKYYQTYCGDCKAKKRQLDYANNQEVIKGKYRDKAFKLLPGEYEAMLKKQNYRCAICNKTKEEVNAKRNLAVDHDHKIEKETGNIKLSIRKLLCGKCNSMLGFAKDDIQILLNAINYLKDHDPTHKKDEEQLAKFITS